MGTGPYPASSDPVSPPPEEAMSPAPQEDPELTAETESAISDLLAAQPGFAMPPALRAQIRAALTAEAATRAALTSNDVDPADPAPPLVKSEEPAREREDLR